MKGDTGDNIEARTGMWAFNGEMVKSFDKHVEKSVPLYKEGHELICQLSDFFVPNEGKIIQIGCSTGVLTGKLANHLKNKNNSILAIDIEEDMIAEANLKNNQKSIQFICEDINSYEIENESANLIIAYYSIQFIHPSQRQLLINKIYKSLKWGGAFIMFEKVRGSDARFQDILSSCYLDYKLKKGYSAENIISKQQSLKSVLEPFSRQGNIDILKRSGFIDIETIQKYICFEGFLAIK
ncbi:methyltransferase domain-containing protein [Prochlorococcus marinus]|uniref:methyltransferase domain-containing protein n=1 Tax=Prochlorococcus marinus TaxID=1219 RepID=UPI001ADB8799|nr:methyltransferase domain-containing protein [Prochlorococcus marinus]MBO8217694.1 methyltransferase domain-containing protein [Prochlorococcus marinus XMU1405]MBW3040857.1 methyltransferase [Prochlorococcus marinus str. MU1405]MBW3048317.1 methyltransferase [Prochlorococcus marinus str. MU1406]